jgi:hypothetical protein
MVRVAGLLIPIVLIAAAGCVSRTGQRPEDSTPKPDGGMISAEQLRKADPCGFADSAALAEHGEVDVEDEVFFTDCAARVTTAGGGYTSLNVELNLKVGEDTLAEFTEGERRGVPVWSAPEDEFGCERNVVPHKEMVIALTAAEDAPSGTICQLADDAVDEVVDQLLSGAVRTYDVPDDSLLNQDACALIDDSHAARVPGIDMSLKLPAFNDQSCSWGDDDVTSPGVFVSFTHGAPAQTNDPRDQKKTIDGHAAVMTLSDGDEFADLNVDVGPMLPSCDVDVDYRDASKPAGEVETVGVSVRAQQAATASCPLALELATSAMSRLPG